ncbi:MAG: MOSC N-terminal beta barrel domain-containing protein [Mucilaginibacter sp.]
MLKVSEIYIYPIKSLGGISLQQAEVTDRGFKYDRRWMLVDANNHFLTQREFPAMALLKVGLTHNGLLVTYTKDQANILIPFEPLKQEFFEVTIWDDTCTAQAVSDEADKWFTGILGFKCRLVYMPDETKRHTDINYTSGKEITSFADAYPFMLIGQASLDELNGRLNQPLPINRFRPNMVFPGALPFDEDIMDEFVINNIPFNGVKLCARCVITTIDQTDAFKRKEPLKTLSTYRSKNNKIYFGQNAVHSGTGIIKVGDELKIITRHTEERFIIPS